MNQGFREVWLLDGRMTMEDRLWLSTFHNRFHGGSSATLAEKFEFKDEILGKWKVHADKKGICSKSESGGESYHTKMWNYVQAEKLDEGKFCSGREFRRVRALATCWTENKCMNRIVAWSEEFVDFSDSRLDLTACIVVMHQVSVAIWSKLKGHANCDDIGAVIAEAMKFCIPNVGDPESGTREVPQLLNASNETQMIELLDTILPPRKEKEKEKEKESTESKEIVPATPVRTQSSASLTESAASPQTPAPGSPTLSVVAVSEASGPSLKRRRIAGLQRAADASQALYAAATAAALPKTSPDAWIVRMTVDVVNGWAEACITADLFSAVEKERAYNIKCHAFNLGLHFCWSLGRDFSIASTKLEWWSKASAKILQFVNSGIGAIALLEGSSVQNIEAIIDEEDVKNAFKVDVLNVFELEDNFVRMRNFVEMLKQSAGNIMDHPAVTHIAACLTDWALREKSLTIGDVVSEGRCMVDKLFPECWVLACSRPSSQILFRFLYSPFVRGLPGDFECRIAAFEFRIFASRLIL